MIYYEYKLEDIEYLNKIMDWRLDYIILLKCKSYHWLL
jgi:hypothetical protein